MGLLWRKSKSYCNPTKHTPTITKTFNVMENLTHETRTKTFTQLTNEVSEIKRMLLEKSNEQPADPDRWFDLNELCNYLPDKPAKATVYRWVRQSAIPHYKGARKLRFLKSEIDIWLKTGKRKTVFELSRESAACLKKRDGKVVLMIVKYCFSALKFLIQLGKFILIISQYFMN